MKYNTYSLNTCISHATNSYYYEIYIVCTGKAEYTPRLQVQRVLRDKIMVVDEDGKIFKYTLSEESKPSPKTTSKKISKPKRRVCKPKVTVSKAERAASRLKSCKILVKKLTLRDIIEKQAKVKRDFRLRAVEKELKMMPSKN